MRVIKAKKTYRNGIVEEFIILKDDDATDYDIDEIVSDWAESDENGRVYGYGLKWELVEDKILITKIIKDEINNINMGIKALKNDKTEFKNYLKNIKI